MSTEAQEMAWHCTTRGWGGGVKWEGVPPRICANNGAPFECKQYTEIRFVRTTVVISQEGFGMLAGGRHG